LVDSQQNATLESPTVLERLFSLARQKDEFEFCCSILRLKGMQAPGWDTLQESLALINSVAQLAQAPLVGAVRLRLILLLYCHVTEMADFYAVPANLLRVVLGERYSLTPFIGALHSSGTEARYPLSKAERIEEWAIEAGVPEVGALYRQLLVKQVRNAFFHSDYILHDGHFRIAQGERIEIGGTVTRSVPLDWLLPRLELAINTALQLFGLVREHIASYEEPKVVQGRLGPNDAYIDVELLATREHGLYGFQSPPASSNQTP